MPARKLLVPLIAITLLCACASKRDMGLAVQLPEAPKPLVPSEIRNWQPPESSSLNRLSAILGISRAWRTTPQQ